MRHRWIGKTVYKKTCERCGMKKTLKKRKLGLGHVEVHDGKQYSQSVGTPPCKGTKPRRRPSASARR